MICTCNLGVSYGQSTITPRKRTYSNSNNLIHSERLSSHKKPKSGAVSSLFNNVSEDVKLNDDHDMYMWHPELPSLLSDNTNADSNMNDVQYRRYSTQTNACTNCGRALQSGK
eukprot:1037522_1